MPGGLFVESAPEMTWLPPPRRCRLKGHGTLLKRAYAVLVPHSDLYPMAAFFLHSRGFGQVPRPDRLPLACKIVQFLRCRVYTECVTRWTVLVGWLAGNGGKGRGDEPSRRWHGACVPRVIDAMGGLT